MESPGLFANLADLSWGDEVIVHAFGQQYVYQVREVDALVDPQEMDVLDGEDYPWLTLITCRGYDQNSGEYRWRVVVRAVQVRVE